MATTEAQSNQRKLMTVKALSADGIRKLVEERRGDQIVQVLRILECSAARDSWM